VVCKSRSSVIGKVGSTSYPTHVEIISRHPIPIGTYIAIPFKSLDIATGGSIDCCAIGVISSTSYRRLLPISPTTTSSESIGIEDEMLRYSPSQARLIALICSENGKTEVRVPNVPPPPDSEVFLAPAEILSQLFSCRRESSIKIGYLLTRPEVEIYVDINALTKHLFITGTTGSGKSNTVAVLADRIASYGGTVVIYDVHGEYWNLDVSNRDKVRLVPIEYKINPLEIPPKVLARMIVPEGGATIQRMLVTRALEITQKIFREIKSRYGLNEKALEYLPQIAKEVLAKKREQVSLNPQILDYSRNEEEEVLSLDDVLVNAFKEYVKNFITGSKLGSSFDKEPIQKACAKVDEFFENAAISFKTPNIASLIASSTLIVLNVSILSDEQKDYVLKVVLDELLWSVKHSYFVGRPQPVVVFIEEAHLFLSNTASTISRYSIERVAREGRKFGLALGIVSQRPRNIDMNTLSQIQNFVFMKLVQEADQQSIMNASDMLTEDLARSLATMGLGEALILGEWVGRFPIFVKIDKHEGKKIGATLDIASIWRSYRLSTPTEKYSGVVEASRDFEELFS
jgi:DNA helicase HerA-like ATPase